MSAFTAINLAELPAPNVVETLSFESIFTEMKADAIVRNPDLAQAMELESEPVVILLEVAAYRELNLRQRINDAARATMLAYAGGDDLENLGALFGVERGVIQPANLTASPPVPEIREGDDRLRTRIQLALEGFTTCGTIGSYQFWGLSASPDVKDISVHGLGDGHVQLTVLSRAANGAASIELLDAVGVETQRRRPLTDLVTVQSATIQNYEVEASLTLYEGPDSTLVELAAQSAVEAYVEDHHRLGHDITLSGLYAALHRSGVQNVTLTQPTEDLVIADDTAAYCTSISIAFGGRDV